MARVLLFLCKYKIPFLGKAVRILLGSDIHCQIPEGLRLGHPYGIVIHSRAQLGRDVTVMQHVTIGSDAHNDDAPVIGSGVYIGAGAVLLGKITVGDGAKIGANAVVLTNVPANSTAVGVPARVVPNFRANKQSACDDLQRLAPDVDDSASR